MSNRWGYVIIAFLVLLFVYGVIEAEIVLKLDTFQHIDFGVDAAGIEAASVFAIMLYMWHVTPVIMALILLLAALNAGDYLGNALTRSVLDSATMLVCFGLIIFAWWILYTPVNITIPNTMEAVTHSKAPAYVSTYYNYGFLMMMVGIAAAMVVRATSTPDINRGVAAYNKWRNN
jgi:hypothetical protein